MQKRIQVHAATWMINAIILIAMIGIQLVQDRASYLICASVLLLTINILTIIKVRRNWYLLISTGVISYCNYSIVYANHLNKLQTYFTTFSSEPVAVTGVNILLLFAYLLLLLMPRVKNHPKYPQALVVNNRYNLPMVLALSCVLVFILYFGFTRPAVAGMRGSPSTYYEYSLIILVIAVFYAGKNKGAHLLINIIMAAYALQNFVYGGRVTGVQIIICWVLCYGIDKLSLLKAAPIALIGFMLLSMIGSMRANFVLNFDNMRDAILNILNSGGTLDTAYSAYFTSLTFVEVRDIIAFSQRIEMLGAWALSMFLGGSVPNSNLAVFTRNYYVHYYGGVLPFFGYFYLGIPGIVAFALYIKRLCGRFVSVSAKSKGLLRCIAIYVTSTSLRWYLYSPSQIVRGVMILTVCYILADAIDTAMKTGSIKIRIN